MFLEVLVAGTCLAGKAGCGSATSAYYQQSAELKKINHDLEEYGKKIAKNNQYIMYAITPIAAVASGKPVTITITRRLVFNVDYKKQACGLLWSW